MRVLVVSDSHGDSISLRRAILAQPKAEVVIHLGDGEVEAQRLKALNCLEPASGSLRG